VAPAELTWALIMAAMRRLPQYIGNLKHGAWQQSGLKAASMPPNFGSARCCAGRTLGIWGYGRIGQLVAGYGRAFGMQVLVWGRDEARPRARPTATRCRQPRRASSPTRRAVAAPAPGDETRGLVTLDDLAA
jgi:D-3-phosphoglycerate dehydrogenase